MKILGAFLAVCAAAAVIPYKVEIDKENKTFRARSLTYDLCTEKDENGETAVHLNIDILSRFKKAKEEEEANDEEAEEEKEEEEEVKEEETKAQAEDETPVCDGRCEGCTLEG